MVNFQSPSVQFVETAQGNDIRGVSTSVGGFLGVCQKGPVGQPQYITSMTQFQQVFGGAIADSYLYEQVKGFFDNGGASCWVSRAAHYTDISDASTLSAVPSTVTLKTATGGATAASLTTSKNAPFSVANGDILQLSVDGGALTPVTFTATEAVVTGHGATYLSLPGGTLVVAVDGNNQQTITFDSSCVDQATTLAFINSAGRFFHTASAGAELSLITDRAGSSASLEVAGGSALSALGLTATIGHGGGTVSDLNHISHTELASLITSATNAATYSPAGGSVGPGTLTSKTTGSTSSIAIGGGGAAAKLGFAVSTVTGASNAAPVSTIAVSASSPGAFGDNLSVSVQPTNLQIGTLRLPLAAGLVNQASITSTSQVKVGDYLQFINGAKNVRVLVTTINGTTVGFPSVTVPAGGIASAGSQVLRERFTVTVNETGQVIQTFVDLAANPAQVQNYFATVINTQAQTPIYVMDLAAAVADARPQAVTGVSLIGGNDGSPMTDNDYVGDSGAKTGLHSFDGLANCNMLSIPGVTSAAVQRALVSYTLQRADMIAVLTTPMGLTPQQAATYKAVTANLVGSYGALYYPWVKIISPATGTASLSPVDGFAQGRFASTDARRNVGKAPAGTTDGLLTGVIGVERDVSRAEYDLLYPNNINAVQSIPGNGICLFGSRTLDSGKFNQISTRRLFMFIEQSLVDSSGFVLFEPNNRTTRSTLVRSYSAFLRNTRLGGLLDGASDKEAFFVLCDESNNPESQIAAGLLRARVGIKPNGVTEFLEIDIEQKTATLAN